MVDTREKLEKELRFLEESLDAGVISKEEYERNKERIDNKILELSGEIDKSKIENTPQDGDENSEVDKTDYTDKDADKEKEDMSDLNEGKDETYEDLEEVRNEVQVSDGDLQQTSEDTEDSSPKDDSDGKDQKPLFKVVVWVLLLLIIIAAILFTLTDNKKNNGLGNESTNVAELKPLCESDAECKEKGKIGICENAGEIEAKCIYYDVIYTRLTVLNDINCPLCNTSRVIALLTKLFPGTEVVEIDSNSDEGKNLISTLKIDMLPSYIYDENLSKNYNFEKIGRAFQNMDNMYIMSNDAAGANLHIQRVEKKNRIDLFYDSNSNSSKKVQKSLESVKNLFKNKIIIEQHDINTDILSKELQIKTTPFFLINNKIRFSGIQSSESIKEIFCKMNDLDECDQELSREIIE